MLVDSSNVTQDFIDLRLQRDRSDESCKGWIEFINIMQANERELQFNNLITVLLTAFWFQYSGFCFVLLLLSFILNPCLLLNQMFGFVCSNRVRIMSCHDVYYCTPCKCFHLHITQELLSLGNHCRFCADVNTSGGLELLLAELQRFLLTMFLNIFLRNKIFNLNEIFTRIKKGLIIIK